MHSANFICTVVLIGLTSFDRPAKGADASVQEVGQQIVKTVHESFFDAAKAEAWHASHKLYWSNIAGPGDFKARTQAVLGELRTSHVGYYTPDDVEHQALSAIFAFALGHAKPRCDQIQADIRHDGFIRRIFAGGAAEKAGLKRGDRVIRADGAAFHPVRSFQGKSGKLVQLSVQKSATDPAVDVAVFVVQSDPRDEWLTAQKHGTGKVSHRGRTIGYVPIYCGAGEQFEDELRRAVDQDLADAEALIVDFRDGWGGCNPSFVDIFSRTSPKLESIDRSGKTIAVNSRWTKPFVLLINGGARSGKEVVAYAVQKHHLGRLVGTRTAGAVVAGRCFPLSNKSLLYLAVADVRIDGVRLEGVGVAPDVVVEDKLEYAQGADPQRDAALDIAVQMLESKNGTKR